MVLTADSSVSHVMRMRMWAVTRFLGGVYVATVSLVPCVIGRAPQGRMVETVLKLAGEIIISFLVCC